MDEDRLIKIETKLAFQEHTIKELNDVLYDQQKQIDQLESTCKDLVDRINGLSEDIGEVKTNEEKPPHY